MWPINSTYIYKYTLKGIENVYLYKNLYMNVHSSIIHNKTNSRNNPDVH